MLPWLLLFGTSCSRITPAPLEYKLLQCGMNAGAISQGPVCELPLQSQWAEQRIVRVAIPQYADDLRIEGGYLDGSPGPILQIRVKPKANELVLRYPRKGATQKLAVIPIVPYATSPLFEQGIASLMAGNRVQAEQQLRMAAVAGTPTMQSRARRQLAKFLLEEDGEEPARLREALSLFEQAAQLAKSSGEISDEAYTTLNQATLRQKYFRQAARAEQILDAPRIRELQHLLPGLEPWLALYQGVVFASANPYRALEAVKSGIEAADRYKDDRAGEQLCRQRALLLHTLGRLADAQGSCSGRTVNPCWDAHNKLVQAQIQLMQLEATHQIAFDPTPALDEVINLLKSECPGSHAKQSEAQIYLAHAQLLIGAYDKLSEREMAAWPQPQDPELYAELLTVRGELALIHGERDATSAENIFQTLRKLAQKNGLQAYAWRALIGLARTQEQSNPQRSLSFYQEALSLLEEWAEQLPIGLGHGSFLGRYEDGTRHYVGFLLRQGKPKLALDIVRRVRVLGLLALLLTRQVEELSELKRSELLKARIDFEESRLSGDPAAQALMRGKLFDQLSEILGQRRIFPLPPAADLAPGEALLSCFPVFPETHEDMSTGDWVCFATRDTAAAPVVARIGVLDPAQMTRSALSDKLLKPFMGVLASARVIRVLEYGRFSRIPLHLLPLPKPTYVEERPMVLLGDRHAVVYALDLPRSLLPAGNAAPSVRDGAFLIMDPQKEHPELSRCAAQIEQEVGSLFGPPRKFQVGMAMPEILTVLSRSSFFHFAGHGTPDPGEYVYGLGLSSIESISASLLLQLRHVPTNAVLLGCDTGSTPAIHGDSVTIGVAQALLVRGAHEVIGTAQTIRAKTAAVVECKLYCNFSTSPQPYPFAAALQKTLHDPAVEALGQSEQGAFRSYVY